MASTSTSTGIGNTSMQQDDDLTAVVQREMEAGGQASNERIIDVPSEAGNNGSIARNQRSVTEIQNASEVVGTDIPVQGRETELHRAVRQRDLRYIPSLAGGPDPNGMPPLYLAVHLGYSDIAIKLIETFGSHLSYEGPKGQNVLHVAALRSEALTNIILGARGDLWDKADECGRKPLHLAASVGVKGITALLLQGGRSVVMTQADNFGMCPIHVAASVGAMDAIREMVSVNDSSWYTIGDINGGTFLHVAVESRRTNVVKYVCSKPVLERIPFLRKWKSTSPASACESILNLKDKDGNTALHLAVKTRDESIFSHLLGNRHVGLNHVNNDGYTPLDVASMIKIQQSYASRQNPTEWMIRALAHSGAYFSARMRGSDSEKMQNHHQEDLARSTESVLVASALIATLTFAAAFTMPGSYKTEGHPKAGTPALGRHYGFKVFLVADILAFFCSVAATYSLAEYGNRGDPLVRCIYARRAVRFFHVALKSVIVAFTLGVSVVMWDISVLTTIVVCVAALALVLYGNEALAHDFRLMWAMYRRFGFSLSWTLYPSTSSHLNWNTWRLRSFSMTLAWNTVKLCSTYIFIFTVAYVAQLKQKGGN